MSTDDRDEYLTCQAEDLPRDEAQREIRRTLADRHDRAGWVAWREFVASEGDHETYARSTVFMWIGEAKARLGERYCAHEPYCARG